MLDHLWLRQPIKPKYFVKTYWIYMLTTWKYENIVTFYPQTQNLRDYSWLFAAVSDILRLFAAITGAISITSRLYPRIKIHIYEKIY